MGELKSEIREKEKSILLLESSLTKIFTTMASGKITKEIFLHKKEVINDSITNQQNAIAKLQEQLETLSNGRTIVEKSIAELNPLQPRKCWAVKVQAAVSIIRSCQVRT